MRGVDIEVKVWNDPIYNAFWEPLYVQVCVEFDRYKVFSQRFLSGNKCLGNIPILPPIQQRIQKTTPYSLDTKISKPLVKYRVYSIISSN